MAAYQQTGSREDYLALLETLPNRTMSWAQASQKETQKNTTDKANKTDITEKLARYRQTGSKEDYFALLEALPERTTIDLEAKSWAKTALAQMKVKPGNLYDTYLNAYNLAIYTLEQPEIEAQKWAQDFIERPRRD